MTAPFLLLIALILGVEVARRLLKRDISYKDALDGFQAVLTAMAILLGGYWYFVERKGAPHADLEAQLNVVPIGVRDTVAVEATITVKNIGEQLLRIRKADLRLQYALLDAPIAHRLATADMRDWSQTYSGKQPMFHEAEFQWPTQKWFNSSVEHEIEPGEADIITATFFVPCSVREVRVAASIEKASTKLWWSKPNPLFWKVRQFASTVSACRQAAGGRRNAT